ncbi:hypothetical protein D8674_003087 [Pyrus ussuriensis x Pyrus communis]|uniref:Uncharacterized protein n=1 Tax=Pyrus ussuriensis x Pyrus communis TaxID=2448454 RepID=A0A5N5FLJ7_9ROSA|nr:hypothetical protein D8674_003087 [Pyrus ussuriensis x Pyrus communis]
MAVREYVEGAAEKGLKQQKNPDVDDRKEAEKAMKVKLNSTEEEMMKNCSCFKPKAGSVFPAKRKSVKRMMFDRFVLKHFGSSAVSVWPPSPHKP